MLRIVIVACTLLVVLYVLTARHSAFLPASVQLKQLALHWEVFKTEADQILKLQINKQLVRPHDAIPLSPDRMTQFVSELDQNDKWINSWKHENVWLTYPVVAMGSFIPGAVEHCPRTVALLKPLLPRIAMAGFSRLVPNGKMTPHMDDIGPAFGTAAVHICLTGKGVLHVDQETTQQVPGKLIMFDSTRTHWVQNGPHERILLYLTWNL